MMHNASANNGSPLFMLNSLGSVLKLLDMKVLQFIVPD